MDGELLRSLYHLLLDPASGNGPRGRHAYGDGVVAFVYVLGVLCGRSPRWALDKRNWPLWARRLRTPGYSQLMRRLRTDALRRLIVRLDATLRSRLPRACEKAVDGKPLAVGGFSKDPDARRGRVPGGWAKGYRLHAVVDAAAGAVEAFAVTPMDAGEATVAAASLLPRLDLHGCVLRADANYDSNRLYAAAAARGGRLLAFRRKPGAGLGHHAQHPDRLRAIAELERASDAPARRRAHKRHRDAVERAFAHLTNLPFGLAPLPNHVRRLRRVRLWVGAKVLLFHLHLTLRQATAAAA